MSDQLDAIRATHIFHTSPSGKVGCLICGPWGWPCDTKRVLDALDESEEQIANLLAIVAGGEA